VNDLRPPRLKPWADPADTRFEETVSRPAPASSTADRVDALIARSSQQSDIPAVAGIIQDLHAAVRRETVAALDVVRLILKDPGLSSKVLRVVNSAFYRPRSDPISTITRAVLVLGFETIRDVATGLVLVEALLRGGGSGHYIRDSLQRSLHRGLLARELSARVGYPEPEEAYLLGLFADWGMLWTAAWFPEEFEEATALQREQGGRLEDAVREVLGVPPAELAATMLQRWNFPATYAEYFRLSQPARVAGRSPGDRLLAVVGVAAEATAPCPDDTGAPTRRALERFQRLFDLGPEPFAEAAAIARSALREQSPIFGLGAVAEPAAPATPSGAAAAGTVDAPRGGDARAGEGAAPAQAGDPQAALAIIAEVTRAIVDQLDINDILAMVIEGVARAGGFDVVCLLLLTPARDQLVGRLGYGEGVKELLPGLRIPLGADGGVLAEAVMQARPRVVPSGSPAPQLAAVRSFVVHPLAVRGMPVGALVAGRVGGGETGPSDLGMVRLFSDQAALALDRTAR